MKKICRHTIGIIGKGTEDEKLNVKAREIGRMAAEKGIPIVCGGKGGVMEAVCRGAKEKGGLTIGILPDNSKSAANPYIDIAIPTGTGEARNLVIIRSSDAIIAIGGGWGALSEIAFALKLGKPVIGLDTWNPDRADCTGRGIIPAANAENALTKAVEFLEQEKHKDREVIL